MPVATTRYATAPWIVRPGGRGHEGDRDGPQTKAGKAKGESERSFPLELARDTERRGTTLLP